MVLAAGPRVLCHTRQELSASKNDSCMKLFIYGQRVDEIKRKRVDFQASGRQILSEILELRAFHVGNVCVCPL